MAGLGDEAVTIGQLAARVGVSVSAIRFYEERGLLRSSRNAGGQRRFRRSDIRRVSFVLIAQRTGLTLQEIAQCLQQLPDARTPTPSDWQRISRGLRATLDERISMLTRMRDRLDGCIGCGCLSLKTCAIYNAGDHAALDGPGPRYLLGPMRKQAKSG